MADRPQPLVGVAQIYARDVAGLPRPEGADLLQVLWCPYTHPDVSYLPSVRLVWSDSTAVKTVAADPSPQVVVGDEGYVPQPCVVHPEPVGEYPVASLVGVD